MKHPLLRFWTVFFLFWLFSACRAVPRTENPGRPPLKPSAKALYLGEITGPAAKVMVQEIKRAFSQNHNLDLVSRKRSNQVLSGKTTFEIKDTPGSDLVKIHGGSGPEKEITIRDPFIDQDFAIRKKMPDVKAAPVRFIQRQGLMTLTYTIEVPGNQKANKTETLTADYTGKFGGINQQLPPGGRIEDLPAKDKTMESLARQLALKLVRALAPESGGGFEPELDAALNMDPLAESPTAEGVRLARAGMWKEAVKVWQKILTYDPEHPAANYNIGVSYERSSGPDNLLQARKYYATAVKSGNNPLYRQALTRVTVALRQLKNQERKDSEG